MALLDDKYMTTFVPDELKTSPANNVLIQDIYDRVINLRFTVTNSLGVEETFVIRSDFELVYPNLIQDITGDLGFLSFLSKNNCYIRKCQHKPSIKVQYKRVSLNASIKIDIFIHNFYMLDKDGQLISNFNSRDFVLQQVELSMGYYSQYLKAFMGKPPMTLEAFRNVGFNESATLFGIPVITMSNVYYTQTDKLPPDMVLHLHGWVGNTMSMNTKPKVEVPATSYEVLANSDNAIKPQSVKGSYLENVYYTAVTTNFLKKKPVMKYDKAIVKAGINLTTGKFLPAVADQYGINVYLSKKAIEYSGKIIERFPKDKNGAPIAPIITIEKTDTAEAAMNKVESVLGLKNFSHALLDTTGDYIVFLKDELNNVSELLQTAGFNRLYLKTSVARAFNNQIPAVYNISSDAICTIVCPFFCFINPFEKLRFKSRYSLSGLVSYFTNFNATQNEFYALWENVSFATVEDINECTIVCKGNKKEGL